MTLTSAPELGNALWLVVKFVLVLLLTWVSWCVLLDAVQDNRRNVSKNGIVLSVLTLVWWWVLT